MRFRRGVSVAVLLVLFWISAPIRHVLADVWDPLKPQRVEPDTLYFLDVAAEQKLQPGDGGLIPGDPANNPPWTKVVATDGKFHPGLRSRARQYGYVWMPSIGLLGADEFTVELWLRCDQAWAEAKDQTPLLIFDEHGTVEFGLHVHDGRLTLHYGHLQDSAGPVKAELPFDLRKDPIPAGQWANVAVTLAKGTLVLYVEGKEAGRKEGLHPPRVWSDASRGDGLCLLGGRGRGADAFSLSDLRISRHARAPGKEADADGSNVLTVHPDRPTGETVRQTLLGGLHRLRGEATEKMAAGALNVLRTDKLLVVTPIKAGGADAEHPSQGVTGKYSYDWQVVDRTFDYYRRLKITPYISIDATPQILGGSVPPMKGDPLHTALSASSGFPRQIPSDFEAFGAMVQDLVYHVIVERKDAVPYWGVWNEPDGPTFWNQNLDDYLRLYDVCAKAVKAVGPSLKVGGPETGDYNPKWIQALIRHCAEQKVPLDFVSWHYYQSTVDEVPRVRAQVDQWAKEAGLPAGLPTGLPLVCGEWCWQIHNFPKTGYVPWRSRNYYLNDWHAAFAAASLIEMQRAGVVYGIYTNPVAEAGAGGFDASGLMSAEHPWANLNVFRMWSKLGPKVVEADYAGRPGVFALASRDEAGRLTVLVADLRYRKDAPDEVLVRVPGVGSAARVTQYVVDDAHSNAFDAGPGHAELEQVGPPPLEQDAVRLTVKPRGVHLLIFDPRR